MAVTVADLLTFCNRTIAGHLRAVNRLGDDLLNSAPPRPDASTPFQLVTHAFAACEWWCAHIICGRPSDRERQGEFVATGSTADLQRAADRLRDLLADLGPELEAATALANPPVTTEMPLVGEWTTGAAMIHAYEELAQHLGHLEMTVDILLTG